MKKSINILAAVLVGASSCLFSSCEDNNVVDFLDKQPSNELTGEEVFSDWNMLKQFHNDTYNFLRHGACRIENSWLDAATDLAETSYANGGVRTTFNIGNYYGSAGAAELTATWEHFYRGIRKCNMTITRINDVPKDPSLTTEKYEQDKLNYISEARFLRAYFYWEMFLRYGPVPVVTDVLDPDGDLLSGYTTRPTVKEYVVDFILPELQECESGLIDYATAWDNSYAGRVGQPMARALYSRIMLYMASPRYASESGITWQQAADAAKDFMDTYGSNFSLCKVTDGGGNIIGDESYTNAILGVAYQNNNPEVIFYRNDVAITWSAIKNDTPVGEGGNGGCCPSQNLVDMYDMVNGTSPFASYDVTGAPQYNGSATPAVNAASGYDDVTPWTDRDPRMNATVLYQGEEWGNGVINVVKGMRDNPVGNANATPTGYYLRKYIPEQILMANHAGNARRLWIIMRYAEIMLNYAEAVNEVNGPCQEVYDMLDAVRQRAGIAGSVADRADLNTKESMRNFIHKERTIEFAFEEHRAWDVRRWNCATEALSRPIYGIEVASDGTITRKVAQNRVFQDKMYLYPIPEGEVWKTNITNNAGW